MFCNACGDQVPESSKFCGSCGASLSPESVPTRQTTRQVHETKNSGTGIVLSFFWTGLGQLYAGQIARGLVMMGITPIVWAIGWFGGFATFFGGLGTIVGRTAQKAPHGQGLAS
jgi:TM2 domain-containing membrane protein YozV